MTNFKKLILAICLIAMILTVAIFIARTQQTTITKTVNVTLTVKAVPDFSLVVTPTHLDSFVDRVASYTASVTSINDFTGVIAFSDSGLPSTITVTYFPSDTLTLGAGETMGVQIDVGIPLDETLVGDYVITITAESGDYN